MKVSELISLIKNYQDHDDISFDQMKLIFGESSKFDIRKFYKKINVLDHGFVELIDGPAEDPRLKIVNAARVSFAKESKELSEKDEKLVSFLQREGHLSTFRHSYFTFRIRLPLCVFRQFWKYQIGSEWMENSEVGSIQLPDKGTCWSEESGRYVQFEPLFWVPDHVRIQSKNNKQGSSGKLDVLPDGTDPVERYKAACLNSFKEYEYLLAAGAAKEQCRGMLPQSVYTTAIWTASLQAVLFMLSQRLPEDAQGENREAAFAFRDIVEPILSPLKLI
jgi:thymidylate synthase (FAD)